MKLKAAVKSIKPNTGLGDLDIILGDIRIEINSNARIDIDVAYM